MRLLEPLRARLLAQAPEVTQHDDYDMSARPAGFGAVKASVLLPHRPARAAHRLLIFTRRTATLARHSAAR